MALLPTPLCSVADLAPVIDDPRVVILRATPGGREDDPHIPGSHLVSFAPPWSDPDAALPNTKPAPEAVRDELERLGVRADSHIVIYEDGTMFAGPRFWWLIKHLGFPAVSVLNGGLKAWVSANLPTTTTTGDSPAHGERPASAPIAIDPNTDALIDLEQMRAHVQAGDVRIIDAREAARFHGKVEEPRPGLRRGHIPTACNSPYTDLQNEGMMYGEDKLREKLAPYLDERPVVATCGSGVTACIVALALAAIGREDVSVYDGSWTEWGQADGPEIVAGD